MLKEVKLPKTFERKATGLFPETIPYISWAGPFSNC